jgi:hypothetical protein
MNVAKEAPVIPIDGIKKKLRTKLKTRPIRRLINGI